MSDEFEYKEVTFICHDCSEWLKGFGDEHTELLGGKAHSNGFCLDERCTICNKFTHDTYAITMKELIQTIGDEQFRIGNYIGGNAATY